MVDTIDMDDADRRILSEILYTQKDIYSIKNTDATDLKILSGFNELLSAVNTESGVENFIQVIQQVGLLSFSYQKENKLLSAFQYLFHEYAQFPDEDIAILPFNSGKIG